MPGSSVLARTRQLLGSGVASIKRPPVPRVRETLDRTLIAFGPRGCFEGVRPAIRQSIGGFPGDFAPGVPLPDGTPTLSASARKVFEQCDRFNVFRCEAGDLMLYAPEGFVGPLKTEIGRHLYRCQDILAERADATVLLEWGTSDTLPTRVHAVRATGTFPVDAPAVALTCAQFSRWVDEAPDLDPRRIDDEGPLGFAVGGAAIVFAVRESAEEAEEVFRSEVEKFSAESMPIRGPGEAAPEMLVVHLSDGSARNLAGDIAAWGMARAPAP